MRLRGKRSRLWCRQQDLNLRTRKLFISELYPPSFCLHIAPFSYWELFSVSRLFRTRPLQRPASAITPRCAFSSAAHCFCGLTVRRCGHSLCVLNFSRFLARLCGWYGIAVLPCFSTSGKVPVTRCGLPLRGTYAVYLRNEPVGAPASPTA